MTARDERPRLRVFRDGRFLEDEPAGAPEPLLPPDSLAPRTSTTGMILSVGPGTDADGVRRDHCYEVGYTAGGRDLVHRTCEVLPRAAADLPDDD